MKTINQRVNFSKEKPKKRNINGIILLDKPCYITSNTALQQVKTLSHAQKAGHTGSLDPLASGMLPICLGEATKFAQFLLEADKRYRVTAKLGIKTATGDAEGEIIQQRPVIEFTQQLPEVLQKFRGPIQQIPSMYSALKHQGKPLYELARQGITIDRPAREVIIHELTLLSQTTDTLTLEVFCSKGTYIRTLVEDIGEVLNCGAHVIELRRLSSGNFNETQMITLPELENLIAQGGMTELDRKILPIDSMLQHWPLLQISDATKFYLMRGQPIIVPQAKHFGWVRVFNHEQFLGVGEVLKDGRLAPRRLINQK